MTTQVKTVLITPYGAARILEESGISCSEYKITRWCREGRIKNARKVGGQWYIDPDEVKRMLE